MSAEAATTRAGVQQAAAEGFAQRTQAASWAALPADLGRPGWAAGLQQLGFDTHKPTVFVAEGLLMYLSSDHKGAVPAGRGGSCVAPWQHLHSPPNDTGASGTHPKRQQCRCLRTLSTRAGCHLAQRLPGSYPAAPAGSAAGAGGLAADGGGQPGGDCSAGVCLFRQAALCAPTSHSSPVLQPVASPPALLSPCPNCGQLSWTCYTERNAGHTGRGGRASGFPEHMPRFRFKAGFKAGR